MRLSVFLLAMLVAVPGLQAQRAPDRLELLAGDSIELTPTVQQSLVQLQEEWQQWINGFYTVEQERFEERVERMMIEVRRLGMRRLPELSRAAAARAVEAARQGEGERATWALDAAESLDPGRPETAFRRAQVARIEGDWGTALTGWIEGYLRLLTRFDGRTGVGLGLWLAYGLLLAGAAWIVLRMVVQGPGLFAALERPLASQMPTGLARLLTALLLLWPVVVPPGLFWVLIYWSILLWGFGSGSEKTVTVLLWIGLAFLPGWVALERSSAELLRSPAHRALDSLAQDRLYGRLFVDLEELVRRFPEEPAVVHLLADLHRELQQWDVSKRYYQRMLELEPENASALIDLGAYYFYNNDFGTAVRYFRQAAEADGDNVAAWFNLSQAYSESYLFDEMKEALQTAQQIDDGLVARYQGLSEESRIILVDGGYRRIPTLMERLRTEQVGSVPAATGKPGPWWTLAVVPVWWVLAWGIARLLRRRPVVLPPDLARGGGLARGLRILVPGLVSIQDGEGVRAFLALSVPALLATLPAVARIGFPLPPGAGDGELAAFAVVGLVTFFGLRFWWDVSHGH